MRSMLWLRLVLIALGAALGVVLLLHGSVLIGGLLCALALTRLAVVLSWQRRRRRLLAVRAARPARWR